VYDDSNLIGRVLILRWDGSQWSVVDGPDPGTRASLLGGIDTLTSNDIWAVGYYRSGPGSSTLVEHWDGTEWSVVPSPDPNPGSTNELRGVDAISPNDMWAVGDYITSTGTIGTYRNLIEHWDGTKWSVVPSPNVGSHHNSLWDVAAVSSNDVWAVGVSINDVTGVQETLTLHWDGVAWNHVPSPNPGYNHILEGVVGISSNDVWAVGTLGNRILMLHWDGTEWTNVTGPAISQVESLYGVAAISSNDVWAVGYACCNNDAETVTLHWDGVAWTRFPSPSPGSAVYNVLQGVSAVSANDVWAAGYYAPFGTRYLTLIEHYSDPCTTPTPTANPTAVATAATPTPTASGVASPTPTLIIPTVTTIATTTATLVTPGVPTTTSTATTPTPPIATPTACTLAFIDVPQDHTFYPNIRCLACRGIISGYADGTFRPGNDITRGQIAKVVSNAAGFSEPITGQSFQDVPTGSPFYEFIERLYTRGHMGGYPCGLRDTEPCTPPENRPYFRPNDNATRGQISKIVSNASGNNDPVSGIFYTDVDESNPFYLEIMRLTGRGVMSGYPCGGPGEPCDPQNRPYFRWGNSVTRGQASKIVANTFFPGCETPGLR
jgi:hypothetical protein